MSGAHIVSLPVFSDAPALPVPANVVSVVGMHRSGTSLVSRILSLVGVGLGPEDQLMPAHERDNPKGYWENVPVVAFNDRLLELLGGSWDDPPALADHWEHGEEVRAFREEARTLIAPIFDGHGTVGWKDPRMSLLLPFWKTVVPVTSSVVVVRHPFEVAASLAVRDGIDAESAADLWVRYTVSAWRGHSHRIVVDYGSVLEDPARAAAHFAAFLDLDEVSTEQLEAVAEFTDPQLRHHVVGEAEVGSKMALALSVFALVESQSFSLIDRVFDAIHAEWVEGL